MNKKLRVGGTQAINFVIGSSKRKSQMHFLGYEFDESTFFIAIVSLSSNNWRDFDIDNLSTLIFR